MRLLISVLVAIVLTGCAGLNPNKEANERYNDMMNLYLGEPESLLIKVLGPPHQSYKSGSTTYLRYMDSRIVPVPAPLQMGGNNRFVMFGGGAASISCDRTFEVENGTIVAWRLHGNGCR
jgi:hypothetical protein